MTAPHDTQRRGRVLYECVNGECPPKLEPVPCGCVKKRYGGLGGRVDYAQRVPVEVAPVQSEGERQVAITEDEAEVVLMTDEVPDSLYDRIEAAFRFSTTQEARTDG